MGVSPGWGGGARLVRLVGRQQALQMLGTAEKLNIDKAMECGLVDREVPEGQVCLIHKRSSIIMGHSPQNVANWVGFSTVKALVTIWMYRTIIPKGHNKYVALL